VLGVGGVCDIAARPYCTGTEATIPDAGDVRCMRYFYRA
jgi:hypothetical protein